jgi:hypothetical protein
VKGTKHEKLEEALAVWIRKLNIKSGAVKMRLLREG